MDCENTKNKIDDYIDNNMFNDDSIEFSEHLAGCPYCSDEYNSIKRITDELNSIEQLELPKDFHSNLMQIIKSENNIKNSNINRNKAVHFIKKNYRKLSAVAACFILFFIIITISTNGLDGRLKSQQQYSQNSMSADGSKSDFPSSADTPAMAKKAESYAYNNGTSMPDYGMGSEYNTSLENAVENESMLSQEYSDSQTELYEDSDVTGMLMDEVDTLSEEGSLDTQSYDQSADQNFKNSDNANSIDIISDTDIPSSGNIPDSSKKTVNNEANQGTQTEHKIIRNAYFSINVKDFNNSKDNIIKIINDYSGYIESQTSDVYATYSYNGIERRDLNRAYMTIKIPAENYSTIKDFLNLKGNADWKIMSFSESAEDVTSQYIDTRTRMEVKKKEEQRLLELISKAEKVEDLVFLEERLSYIRSDIEVNEQQLLNWDRFVAYSTINIDLTEIEENTELNPILGSKINDGFLWGIDNVKRGIENLLILFAENVIIIFILIVVIIVVTFLYKRKKKRKKNITDTNSSSKHW